MAFNAAQPPQECNCNEEEIHWFVFVFFNLAGNRDAPIVKTALRFLSSGVTHEAVIALDLAAASCTVNKEGRR